MDRNFATPQRDTARRTQERNGLLDVVVGDGGFGVKGEENLQEYYTRQLFLCQSTVALSVLRPGGNYMCKLFDMFLDGTIGTIYVLWRCFEKVCVFKPHSSRPANSEVRACVPACVRSLSGWVGLGWVGLGW